MRALERKIPPVVTCLLLGAGMGVTAWLVPALGFPLPARRPLAAVLAIAGLVLAVLGVISFRRVGTTIHPLRPEAASHLVVAGIYRRTRNPMYLGMLLVPLGWAVCLAHPLALLLAITFVPLMNRLQIGPEEAALAARFGAEFAAYRATVRRWL
ncbi:MAG: isoprenylcysteine carboxylmethyltransferase family protein [Planctomycetes bacterium]|nr:isoprenylcysteine carboxylmethyltransferase family protein [Planctomycetota bacterium]